MQTTTRHRTVRGKDLHSLIVWFGVCCLLNSGYAANSNRPTGPAHQTVPLAVTGKDAPPESPAATPGSSGAGKPPSEPRLAAESDRASLSVQTAQLARISDALVRIKSDYVDLVEDRQLVSGCMQGMLRLAPTTSNPEGSSTAGGTKSALQEISDAFSAIEQQSGGAVGGDKLADACVDGMVGTLDVRSAFLDTEEFKELQGGGTPHVAGIGLELKMEAGRLIVVSPIEGTPGSRAGLTSGDAIVQIDDIPIAGLSLKEAVRRLRGPDGSEVTLTVVRSGVEQPIPFVLTREIIRIESSKWASLSPGIAYFRITRFELHTAEKLASAIASAYAANQGALNGLVLDLRNNPGGVLNVCIAVSAAFLPKNALIVYTDGRTKDSRMRLYASSEYYVRSGSEDYMKKLPPTVKTVPMVVLVNHGSASCSEIVAAALQDHKRATIVGERTFGVETVQTIFPLKGNTGLKLTTARYFRPNGNPMGLAGVTPDVVLDGGPEGSLGSPTAWPGDDPAVRRAVELLGGKPDTAKLALMRELRRLAGDQAFLNGINPYAPGTTAYMSQTKFLIAVFTNERFIERFATSMSEQSAPGQDYEVVSAQLLMKWMRSGFRRLDDSDRESLLALTRKMLDYGSPEQCATMIRGDPLDLVAHQLIAKLDTFDVEAYYIVIKRALFAELEGRPEPTLTQEQKQLAQQALVGWAKGLDPTDAQRFRAAFSNLPNATDSELCWIGKKMIEGIFNVQGKPRDWLIRLYFTRLQ